MTTASDQTGQHVKPLAEDGRLPDSILEAVRRNGGMRLEVPGPVIRHVRRGLHLALHAACGRLAAEAASMAEASRDRYAPVPASYNLIGRGGLAASASALDSFDRVRRALDLLGWGCTSPTPPDDVYLHLTWKFAEFYEAIALAIKEDPADEPSGLAALLEDMNTCVARAEAAHEEWKEYERSRMGHSLMQAS